MIDMVRGFFERPMTPSMVFNMSPGYAPSQATSDRFYGMRKGRRSKRLAVIGFDICNNPIQIRARSVGNANELLIRCT